MCWPRRSRGTASPDLVDIIEGERGFVKTMADAVDWDVMLGGLGRDFRVEENGYKIHACCRHGHVSIDQATRMATEHDIRPEQSKTGGRKAQLELLQDIERSEPAIPV